MKDNNYLYKKEHWIVLGFVEFNSSNRDDSFGLNFRSSHAKNPQNS